MSEPSSEPSAAKGDRDVAQPKAAGANPSKPKQPLDDLPHVFSPSISPVGDELKTEEAAKDETAESEPVRSELTKTEAASTDPKSETATTEAGESAPEPAPSAKLVAFPRVRFPEIKISRRFRRIAASAAVIAVAACIGAFASALVIDARTPGAATQTIASIAERQAMQTSIAMLSKEVSALKSKLETASKSSQSQAAKTDARIGGAKAPAERRDENIVTGSIAAPASALPNVIAAATAATMTAPLPLPQPRPQIVQGWSVHLSPDGVVLAEQRGGDLYQVAPGVPLPGLGRVEAIHRDGGRIEVVTAKGVITSPPRRTVRNRFYRFPPYLEPY